MTILVYSIVAVLSAQPALAEQRANKSFTTSNGRTAITAAPAQAAAAPTSIQAPATTATMINATPAGGGQAFIGGGRKTASRSVIGTATRRSGKTFWVGLHKLDGGDTPAPAPSTEEAPPNFSKPGALIRDTGQMPKYEQAEAARTHTIDAGEIVLNNRKAFDVGRAPSIQQGPKDTPPPPTPTNGGSSYSSGAAPNSGAASTGSSSSSPAVANAKTDALPDTTSFNDAF